MNSLWKCEDCGANFTEPFQDDKTVLRCPECKSAKIDIVT